MIKLKRTWLSLCLGFAIAGCTTDSAISSKTKQLAVPTNWSSEVAVSRVEQEFEQDWLGMSSDPLLQSLINLGLNNNYDLQASAISVELAKQQLSVNESTDFPELSLALSQQRAKRVGDDVTYGNSADLSLQLSYELDLWGKLSDQQRQAELTLASIKSSYQQSRTQLISNIVLAWFELFKQETLLALYQERSINLKNNYDIINSGYRLGLNSALDVYLTQNELNAEKARIASQQQATLASRRALQTIIGEYPSGIDQRLANVKAWPQLSTTLYASLPADLIAQRGDIQSTWFDLLAADAGLAVAHKQRFPQLTLSATTGDSSDELTNLLSGNALAWSLLGNISAPLFNAGRLESLEEQARLSVKQKEQQYLSLVFSAFEQAENNLSNHAALNKQLAFYQQAELNALAAESLSFSQYQKGLVSYATVLESQRRAFDAQTNVIQLKHQLIQNRMAIYVAFGGKNLEKLPNTQSNLSAASDI